MVLSISNIVFGIFIVDSLLSNLTLTGDIFVELWAEVKRKKNKSFEGKKVLDEIVLRYIEYQDKSAAI